MKWVPASAITWVALTALLAVLLLAVFWWDHEVADRAGFIIAIVVAFLMGTRRIRVSDHATISIGFVAVFWTLLHLGPPEAAIGAALGGVAVVVAPMARHKQTPLSAIYAVASLVVTACASGWVFMLAGGVQDSIDPWGMAVPATAAAATYHLVNCALVAAVSGLASRQSVWRLFRTYFGLSALTYYPGAGLALLAHLTWRVAGAWPLLAVLPVLYALHFALTRLRTAPAPERN